MYALVIQKFICPGDSFSSSGLFLSLGGHCEMPHYKSAG